VPSTRGFHFKLEDPHAKKSQNLLKNVKKKGALFHGEKEYAFPPPPVSIVSRYFAFLEFYH